MTAKGLANFSIALLSIATLESGEARIAPWPPVARGEIPTPLADGRRAPGPAPVPGGRRHPRERGQPGGDIRAIDKVPRSTGPAER